MLFVLILYISAETYSKNRLQMTDFLRNFSWQFSYSQSLYQKSAERKSSKK